MANIILVGCGKMGGALLRGLANKMTVVVVNPTPVAGVVCVSSPDQIDPAFVPDAIVLAVKPQVMAQVLPLYRDYARSVFLSIAAGQTLSRLIELLGGGERPVVRAMPNLPASIGMGITVATANPYVSDAQCSLCAALLSAIGQVEWVNDEKLIDPVTSLSGSGPAYVFALTEAMAKAGEGLGLSHALAEKLARQTVIGSGALLSATPESAETLRHAVTSKGGTTEAALGPLQAPDGLDPLIDRAMSAALRRAKELS